MATNSVIEVSGLGKAFDVGSGPAQKLWNTVSQKHGTGELWALRDFDLTIFKGDSIGIVGLNGSGKSTLLQLICGTVQPTTGSVTVRGRIVAMLELGAGFNPDFTGRENAMLSGIAYGLEGSMVKARMQRIEDFADIGDYFDRPVREYSSGMYVRLAFAVCANVDADILIVDEVLSVGDSLFQSKCRRFMENFMKTGTIIFVSHDAKLVRSVCSRAVLLEAGQKTAEGTSASILDLYTGSRTTNRSTAAEGFATKPDSNSSEFEQAIQQLPEMDPFWGTGNRIRVDQFDPDALRHGHGGCSITSCYFSADGTAPIRELHGGQNVVLHIEALARSDIARPIFGFIFRNAKGQNLFGDNSYLRFKSQPIKLKPGQTVVAKFKFRFPYLPMGWFGISPSVVEGTQQDHRQLDWLEDALKLNVTSSDVRGGKIGLLHRDIRPVLNSLVGDPAD